MSIREIAKMTGLSTATVSHALNGTRRVSQKSLELIQKAVEETGYKPNFAAQMMRTNRSNIVAIIIPETKPNNSTNGFFFDVIVGARTAFQKAGYNTIVATYIENDEDSRIDKIILLKKQLVEGILFVPYRRELNDVADSAIQNTGLPIVLVDRRIENTDLPMVYADNADGVCRAVKLLASTGHKRIAFVSGPTTISTSYDRYIGYCQALKQIGHAYDPDLVMLVSTYTKEIGKECTEKLLAQGIDAIYFGNDVLLMGAMEYLQSIHVRIPEDIAIMGFDDYDWMGVTTPKISTTYQDPWHMGEIAAGLLLDIIQGKEKDDTVIRLPCELHLRQSHL